MNELEQQFTKTIIASCNEAKKLHYNPSFFLKMVSEHGAVEAAKRIIAKPTITDGFSKLYSLNRLDLSVEAIVIKPEFKALFTKEEREKCKESLRSVKYPIQEEDEEDDEEDVPAEKMSDAVLIRHIKQQRPEAPKVYERTVQERYRNPYVAEFTKRMAKGICQLCGNPAPFIDTNGMPYLESHHIVWLRDDGEDTVYNTVALCPNCHRKMHSLNEAKDVELLKAKAKAISESIKG